MKRTLICILALLLSLSMLFVACDSTPPVNNDNDQNGGGGTTTPPTQNPPADTTFKRTENYLPADFYAQMKTYFESTEKGFYPYDDLSKAPLVCTDVFVISNCVVKSITIPVFSTDETDKNGDFTFTMYVLPNDWAGLRAEMADPMEKFEIKINAAEHGLTENTSAVRKFIKVDLSEYEIELSDEETLGFGHADDTLIPARVMTKGSVDNLGREKYVPAKYMIDEWDVVGYYYYDHTIDADTEKEVGFSYVDNSLLFDFEFERTYESEAAYNEMVTKKANDDAAYAEKLAAVKAAYAGKYLSLMGDSISTFNTVTNDPDLGLSKNPAYSKYTLSGAVYTYARTYWGKLATETDMELCVINSWGGGKVYGWPSKYEGKDGMLLRSYNLAKDGQAPDLILLNFGINDMGSSYSSIQDKTSSRYTGNLPTGDLYQRLTAENKTKTDKEIVAEWFAEVQREAATAGYNPEDPDTITFDTAGKSNIYSCWEAAYALSLQNIKRLYPNAEVFCVTLPDRNHTSSTQPRLTKANTIISALAEYFGFGLVEQANSGVVRENCVMYAADGTGLHPNGKGHAALTRAIVEELYENLQK
ncbi:MAG: SGNH/GDSL hydrolase family protein [Ruminococcaceae bacterium]|nr:SGNH/GDSL hydrolase family protein [Oscillospiraceae bacterium]